MGVGRNGAGAGDSDNGDTAGDLRPHRIMEANRKMAERVEVRLQPNIHR
jgi:hypothetical protein